MKIKGEKFSQALIETVSDIQKLNHIKKELLKFNEILVKEKILYTFFSSPHIPKDEKLKIIEVISYEFQFHKQTCNFLKLLIIKKKLNALKDIINLVDKYCKEKEGILDIRLEVPFEIGEKELERLEFLLGRKRRLNLNICINKNLIFGFRVFFNFSLLDLSLDGMLKRWRQGLNE